MNQILNTLLSQVKIGQSQHFQNMEILPLFSEQNLPFDYITADEALKGDFLELTESNPSGRVSKMKAVNHSDTRILFICGQEFRGAKQNRIVNATILLEKKSEVLLPVSCVEQGRWNYSSKKFSSGSHSYPALRKSATQTVTHSLMSTTTFSSDQSAIWREVDRKQKSSSTRSRTRAMSDIYQQKQDDTFEFVVAFSHIPNAVGLAIAINGELQCIDLFDRPATLSKFWVKLLESSALDALERNRKRRKREREKWTGPSQTQSLLAVAQSSKQKEFDSPGLGKDVRWNECDLLGSALLCDDVVVHLSLFSD